MARRFRLTNKTGRFMALSMSLALTASCSDKEPVNKYAETHKLDFDVSVPEELHTTLKTRPAAQAQACDAAPFGDSGLWLTVTSEPISNTALFRSPKTRAAAVTTDAFYDSFHVYGYAYKGASWAESTDVTPYFKNEPVTNQNGIWTTDQTKYWPGDAYRMHFFAYAPHPDDVKDPSADKPEDAGSLTVSLADDRYTPTFTYTVPKEVTAQKDLVVATADVAGDHNKSMDLSFNHILTAVKVTAAKGMSGTVKRVALISIWLKGTYTFGGDSWTKAEHVAPGNFVLNFDPGQEIRLDPNAETDTPIADGPYTFMMMPQELPAGATLSVTIVDDNGVETKHSSLLIQPWIMGQCVTYRILKK